MSWHSDHYVLYDSLEMKPVAILVLPFLLVQYSVYANDDFEINIRNRVDAHDAPWFANIEVSFFLNKSIFFSFILWYVLSDESNGRKLQL